MNPSLKVNRMELVQAIKLLAKFVKPKLYGEMIMSYDDGEVALKTGGISAKASAEGVWPGQARFDNRFILGLAKALPANDPVFIGVEQNSLRISDFFAPCTWQGTTITLVQVPLNPSLAELLALRLSYSDEEIEESGLSRVVLEAEEKRDSLISQASRILEPLGIGHGDLYRLIRQHIG